MALPEGYLARKGDIVRLIGIVQHDADDSSDRLYVKINGTYSIGHSVDPNEIELKCRSWRVDDLVVPNTHGGLRPDKPAPVLGTHGEFVWIDHPIDGPVTYHANSLEAWVDPKAPLIVDEAAARELTEVQEAMKEPPPVPLPLGSSAEVDDDENIF